MAQFRTYSIGDSVKEYGKRLFAFIRGKVNTDEDAQDILQDVWFQLSNTTEIIDQVGAWLYRVARNKIIDRYRKNNPESLEDYAYENEDGELNFKEILLADTNNPEMQYLKNLFWDQLNEGLMELPSEQREIFILNELEGRTFAEIAARSGENMKTLISRKGYAVKHLRKRLRTLYDEFINY
jgi:RNA polymerase sigma factor (sigma-70 family)